jgi:hypothetical protein
MKVRDRIKAFKRVPASELLPNPKNWRTHPKEQQDALRGVLAEIGIADACIARELPDGSLMLIDGHLRAETVADAKVPVLILDVTEEEADKLLLTLDPLASMADSDADKLQELLKGVATDNEALQQMMEGLQLQALAMSPTQDIPDGDEESDGDEGDDSEANPYTDKVEVPPYEITGPKPELTAIYNDEKASALILAIDASGLPDEDKQFLRAAAYRHVVFNFQEIANYYAHSAADVQQLMEDSALVIVDLNKAISSGWTRLGKALDAAYSAEKESADEE